MPPIWGESGKDQRQRAKIAAKAKRQTGNGETATNFCPNCKKRTGVDVEFGLRFHS
jgi:hypothetical protein